MKNSVSIIGNLGSAPAVTELSTGSVVAALRVATTRAWTAKDGKRQSETTWIDVEVWGAQAAACAKHLTKGARVSIDGRLKTDSWVDKASGKNRSRLKVVADRVLFLSKAPTTVPVAAEADAFVADDA